MATDAERAHHDQISSPTGEHVTTTTTNRLEHEDYNWPAAGTEAHAGSQASPAAGFASHPLNHLSYFAEWGGETWIRLLRTAFDRFIGTSLHGQRVMDLGTRSGKMASLFALLGAEVTGVDISATSLEEAKTEARKWQVDRSTQFIAYNGDLDIFRDKTFDLVFTKSVLVVVPELPRFLQTLARKLKPGGRVVFVENGKGNLLIHALRTFRHRKWRWRRAHFFTNRELDLMREIFDVHMVMKHRIPPVYLIMGHRRGPGHPPT